MAAGEKEVLHDRRLRPRKETTSIKAIADDWNVIINIDNSLVRSAVSAAVEETLKEHGFTDVENLVQNSEGDYIDTSMLTSLFDVVKANYPNAFQNRITINTADDVGLVDDRVVAESDDDEEVMDSLEPMID